MNLNHARLPIPPFPQMVPFSGFPRKGLVGRGGFEPPKSVTADLQSAPFGHSGTYPYEVGAGEGNRTRNLLITNQLLCQLSYASTVCLVSLNRVRCIGNEVNYTHFERNVNPFLKLFLRKCTRHFRGGFGGAKRGGDARRASARERKVQSPAGRGMGLAVSISMLTVSASTTGLAGSMRVISGLRSIWMT